MQTPTCCPDVYWCPTSGQTECPRHGGFDVCCARPDWHVLPTREAWHLEQANSERVWLDQWARGQGAPARLPAGPDTDALGEYLNCLTAIATVAAA